jgi:hypothetical protein
MTGKYLDASSMIGSMALAMYPSFIFMNIWNPTPKLHKSSEIGKHINEFF